MQNTLSTSWRIQLSCIIGVVSACICGYYQVLVDGGAGDFVWIWQAARDLVAGADPYSNDQVIPHLFYPLPAVFIALPLIYFDLTIAGSIFFGISSALFAFGLLKYGYVGLLVFLCVPYWYALRAVQWSPLIASIGLLPALLPLALVKPHTALPVALTSLTKRGILMTIGFGLISLIVMPDWPLRWLNNLGSHQNFIPLFTPLGPLLLLALLRYKDRDAWLLLLATVMPQRFFYDQLYLWLIPKSAVAILLTSISSWIGYRAWFPSETNGPWWTVLCFYLPMLVVILRRGVQIESVKSMFWRRAESKSNLPHNH